MRLFATVLIVWALPASLFWVAAQPGVGDAWVLLVAATASSLALLWVSVRFPFVRVQTNETGVRHVSWWRTQVIPRDRIRRFRFGDYGGVLYIVGWPVVSGSLQSGVLRVEYTDGTEEEWGSTVGSMRAVRQQCEALNEWLGLEVGTGTGERRRSRS